MTLKIKENIPLKNHTTFRVGGNATYFVEIYNSEELLEAVDFAKSKNLPIFVLGGGSDVLVSDLGFDGVVIKILGNKVEIAKDGDKAIITADAGMVWDDLVKFAVSKNLQGVECLSGIPGSVGAAPVQNIGAYGQELKDSFLSLIAFDTKENKLIELFNKDCGFGYRESVFKKPVNKGRYIITKVKFLLNPDTKPQVKYESLRTYLNNISIPDPTLDEVRQAVLTIRKGKFEDPKDVGNAGSFFKNPILNDQKMSELRSKYQDVPCFDNGNHTCKVYAGWFIEKSGWKGAKLGNAAVSSKHALILLNPEGKAAAEDIRNLAEKIVDDVYKKFNIKLEREVQYINMNGD